jgi:hypothetical protein
MKLLFLTSILILTSCSLSRPDKPMSLDAPAAPAPPVPKPVAPPPPVVNPPVSGPVENPLFSEVREKVFKPSCFGCHSEAAGNVGDVNFENYDSAFEARFAAMTAVSEGRMPPRKSLTEEQQKLLVAWVTGGARP